MSARTCLFVALALLAPALPAQAQDLAAGTFYYIPDRDEFDDSDRSSIATPSIVADSPSFLGWKCMDDGLNVLYVFARYLGGDSDDEVVVRYRIDDREASAQAYWPLLQEHEAAHIPMDQVASFTAAARSGRQVLIEVMDPLDGEVISDRFDLDGLAASLQKLECAASGW